MGASASAVLADDAASLLDLLRSEDGDGTFSLDVEDLSSPPSPPPDSAARLPVVLTMEELELSDLPSQAPFLSILLHPIFPRLLSINLSSNDLTLASLLPLLSPSPPSSTALRVLTLAGNPRLLTANAGEGSAKVTVCCANLLSLDVSFCPVADKAPLCLLLGQLPDLRELAMEGCGIESLEGAEKGTLLIEKNKELRILVLADNSLGTPSDLESLNHLPLLTSLDLRENEALSALPNFRSTILSLIPSLASLDGQFCKQVAAKEEGGGAALAEVRRRVEAADSLSDGTSGLISEKEFGSAMGGKVDSTVVE